jgi:gamma-carbonic anhydrase
LIIEYQGIWPKVDPTAFVEQTALVAGDVDIGARSSIWFNCVIRGDVDIIRIGERTNIQDACIIHVTKDKWPTYIGNDTTMGHHAIAHGCQIGNHCLIGMGAIVLDGAEIGDNSIVGAGAVVPPGFKAPPNSLLVGIPAKFVREVGESDMSYIDDPREQYLTLAEHYRYRASDLPKP